MPQTLDTQLEQTFNDLAMARLRDKCPALLDYLVGFEMLKSDDNGSKAVGIFGFEIDDAFFYVPLMFKEGEIQGLESIYSVEDDLFIPLTEGWTDTLIQRKAATLGEPDTRSRRERGVKLPNYATLRQLPGMSGVKFASVAREDREYKVDDLPTCLRKMGAAVVRGFAQDVQRNAKLAAAVSRFYSVLDFAPQQKTAAEPTDEPVIVGHFLDAGAEKLSDEQKKHLLSGGVGITDTRPEGTKSVVFNRVTPQVLRSPTEGGMYAMVMADGTVSDCFVLRIYDNPKQSLVYELKGGRWGTVPTSTLFARFRHDNASFRKELDKIAVQVDKVRPNDVVSFVSFDGNGTSAWRVATAVKGTDGVSSFGVKCVYDPRDLPPRYQQDEWNEWQNRQAPWNYRPVEERITSVLVSDRGNHVPKYLSNKLAINRQSFLALVLEKQSESEYGADLHSIGYLGDDKDRLTSRDFGDVNTLFAEMQKHASDLKIWTSEDGDYNVALDGHTKTLKKVAAIRHLAIDLRIDGELSRDLIEEARRTPLTHKVKLAAELLPFPDLPDHQGGGFMNAYIPEQPPVDGLAVAPSVKNEDVYRYISPFEAGGETESGSSTMDAVQTAAESGQKEVFDAKVLLSLLKTHNPSGKIEEFLPTITAGMDRLGRLLFMMYWHYDDVVEQYGEDDLDEFIDDLRNCFEQLGDIVLFLKKPTLAGDPSSYGLGLTGQQGA